MTLQKARLIRKGDIIRYTSGETEVEEVVRDVVMVIQMANGETLSVAPTDEYTMVPQEEAVVAAPEEESAIIPPPAITGDTDE